MVAWKTMSHWRVRICSGLKGKQGRIVYTSSFRRNMDGFSLGFTMDLTVQMRRIICCQICTLLCIKSSRDDGFESATVNGNSNSTTAPVSSSSGCSVFSQSVNRETDDSNRDCERNRTGGDACAHCVVEEKESYPSPSRNDSNLDSDSDSNSKRKRGKNSKSKYRGNAAKKWEENQRRWRCEWERERVELDRRLKEQLNKSGSSSTSRAINHGDVLKALS
ncbi:probable protein phosphatase 2C 23 [Fagus crenata]